MNNDDQSGATSNARPAETADPLADALRTDAPQPKVAPSSAPSTDRVPPTTALATVGAWPPPNPPAGTAPVYAQPNPHAPNAPPRAPQPTPVYAHPAYGAPAAAFPQATSPDPYQQPYAPPYQPPAQPNAYAQPNPYAQPQQPYPPPYQQPYMVAQQAPPAPQMMPYAPAPTPAPLPMAYTAPAQTYAIVPAQPQMMPMVMQQPMMMPAQVMAPQMVPYGYTAPTGIVRVGNANRLVFAVLAFLLGFIGLHKFYQGKPVWGLIYLLTSWTGVPAIVSVIEGLVALFQTDAAFDADNNLRAI